jgi:hypothetical protein
MVWAAIILQHTPSVLEMDLPVQRSAEVEAVPSLPTPYGTLLVTSFKVLERIQPPN